MTNEEAIGFGNMWLEINEDVKDSSTYTFFQMAIEALEQQKEYISKMDEVRRAYDNISKVELCEDCISRQAVLDLLNEYDPRLLMRSDYRKMVEDLPSVSTEKTGRWILIQRNKYIDISCSKCGNARIKDYAYGYTIDELNLDEINDFLAKTRMNYCECCGAKMLPQPYKGESEDAE